VASRWHHARDLAFWKWTVGRGGGGSSGGMLSLVTATRIWIIVDSRVASKLVGSAELLCAAGKLAGVRLLAGVGANVPRLVFEAVEGLVAHGTFVGTGQIRASIVLILSDCDCRSVYWHHANGGGSHVVVVNAATSGMRVGCRRNGEVLRERLC